MVPGPRANSTPGRSFTCRMCGRQDNYTQAIDVWSVGIVDMAHGKPLSLAGCIYAELLSMLPTTGKSYMDRGPLFPGTSCFPLSPDHRHKSATRLFPVAFKKARGLQVLHEWQARHAEEDLWAFRHPRSEGDLVSGCSKRPEDIDACVERDDAKRCLASLGLRKNSWQDTSLASRSRPETGFTRSSKTLRGNLIHIALRISTMGC